MTSDKKFQLEQDAQNDIGCAASFRVIYRDKDLDGPFYVGTVKIARRISPHASSSAKAIKAALSAHFASLTDEYYSLGQSDEYYENIKDLEKTLGEPLRDEYYRALNDVAYDIKLLEEIKSEEPFWQSVGCDIPESTIRGQFHRISMGGARLTEYRFCYIPPFSEDPTREKIEFHVIPDSIPSTNIYAIIGKNGVGKTSFLKSFAKEALRSSVSHGGKNHRREIASGAFSSMLAKHSCSIFSNVIFVSFSAFDDFSLIQPDESTTAPTLYRFIGLGKGEPHEPSFPPSSPYSPHEMLNRFFDDAMESVNANRAKRLLWLEAVKELAYDEGSDIAHFRNGNLSGASNDASAFSQMSAGHKIALLIVTSLVSYAVEKTLAIIDEPETHLHPPLLSALCGALATVLEYINGVALIATHSPIVLQEIPAKCAWRLDRSGDRALLRPMRFETYGSDINTLTRDVFGLEVSQTGFHKTITKLASKAHGDRSNALSMIDGEMGNEGLMLLRALTH